MASCTMNIDTFSSVGVELDVIEKYNKLMATTLGEDSLYTRGKETLFHLFEDLQLTEKEKAALVVDFIAQATTQLSQTSMTIALSWLKEEATLPYTLAKTKADIENVHASYVKIQEEICLLQKEDELRCIEIEATGAASIRDNGRVNAYKQDINGDTCHPESLENEGLKYFQTKQVEADSYRIFADAYRKSGVVQLGIDAGNDGVYKGLSGTTNNSSGEAAGYTAQQSANAERQRIAYEDSKLNHAANSSASMIGQMLSAEVTPYADDVKQWRAAITALLKQHSTTNLA